MEVMLRYKTIRNGEDERIKRFVASIPQEQIPNAISYYENLPDIDRNDRARRYMDGLRVPF